MPPRRRSPWVRLPRGKQRRSRLGSIVDRWSVHRGLAVVCRGQAVAAGRLERAVAGKLGDEGEVVATADKVGYARAPQHAV